MDAVPGGGEPHELGAVAGSRAARSPRPSPGRTPPPRRASGRRRRAGGHPRRRPRRWDRPRTGSRRRTASERGRVQLDHLLTTARGHVEPPRPPRRGHRSKGAVADRSSRPRSLPSSAIDPGEGAALLAHDEELPGRGLERRGQVGPRLPATCGGPAAPRPRVTRAHAQRTTEPPRRSSPHRASRPRGRRARDRVGPLGPVADVAS